MINSSYNYTPLPDKCYLAESPLHGFGVFVANNIYEREIIGLSHICLGIRESCVVEDTLIRTPLGGYINHSDNPNCVLIKLRKQEVIGVTMFLLSAVGRIRVAEELTLDYNNNICGNKKRCDE